MDCISILFDTNLIIDAEITQTTEFTQNTAKVSRLIGMIIESHNTICIHPAIKYDLENDKEQYRFDVRSILIKKYKMLELPCSNLELPADIISQEKEYTNDWVDNQYLAAVLHNLVHYLVTEDRGIHKKAARLNISDRVLYIDEALEVITNLFPKEPFHSEDVSFVHPLDIDLMDPFFDSLKNDYSEFEYWYKGKVIPDSSRKIIVTRVKEASEITGLTILKEEDSIEFGPKGKTLKICTFKVSDSYGQRRFGELLLKTILMYAKDNGYEYLYVTIFQKHGSLMSFFENFGFFSEKENRRGERIYQKRLKFGKTEYDTLPAIEFNYKFGPFVCNGNSKSRFIVPIRNEYHRVLFPELEKQFSIFSSESYGNSIRKSYISHSKIAKIAPGDLVFFYRSGKDAQQIQCYGIVETFNKVSDIYSLIELVGNRTVFSIEALSRMTKKPVSVINFKIVEYNKKGIALQELITNQVIKSPPQSTLEISKGNAQWMIEMLRK